MKNKLVHRFVIGTFVSLYLLVSVISTIHVVDFFKLSNPHWLAVSLAVAFELGAAASLASLIILEKMNKTLVWILFGAITLMQMQGNMYYAFVNMRDFQGWSELFGLIEEDPIYQKRILAAVSGAILPLVALGFIKSLVDYIKPESMSNPEEILQEKPKTEVFSEINPSVDNFKPSEGGESIEDSSATNEIFSSEDEKVLVEEEDIASLAEEEIEAIMGGEKKSTGVVPGYYGDVVIDGNGVVTTQENTVLPVNSNKKKLTDNSSKVYISPMSL